MRLAALLLMAALCGTLSAAPAPFLESRPAEAVLETGSKERTEALLRWLKAADLAQALLPGQSALPASFTAKLKATRTTGFRVVLKFQGSARAEERALFKKLIAKVTRAEVRGDARALVEDRLSRQRHRQQILLRQLALVRGGGRIRALRDRDMELERAFQDLQDQDIRIHPPRLVTGPARR
jgi:hypothetical protein